MWKHVTSHDNNFGVAEPEYWINNETESPIVFEGGEGERLMPHIMEMQGLINELAAGLRSVLYISIENFNLLSRYDGLIELIQRAEDEYGGDK